MEIEMRNVCMYVGLWLDMKLTLLPQTLQTEDSDSYVDLSIWKQPITITNNIEDLKIGSGTPQGGGQLITDQVERKAAFTNDKR